jgi:hypothetical protein
MRLAGHKPLRVLHCLQGGAVRARDVPVLVISDSNFTRNGKLPRQQSTAAAAAAAGEEAGGPSRSKFGGAIGIGWRESEGPRNVTLLGCRCAEHFVTTMQAQ